MRRISVLTKKPYTVTLARGLRRELPSILAAQKDRGLFLLTDSHVWPLYGKPLADALGEEGITVHICSPGESSKSLESYGQVLEAMAGAGLHRDSLLIALGGGVIGDLGGFAAASYLRGIDFIQIPTTLLAAVDSSVGGKTGINLLSGKNLAGAFHQPVDVYLDPDVLTTISDTAWRDGVAEMIKMAMLHDASLFERLAKGIDPDDADLEALLAASIQYKAEIVNADEKEKGIRRLLNFGHTFGHAIEARSAYALSHGHAVAIGMAMVTRAAVAKGSADENIAGVLKRALISNGLPYESSDSVEELLPFVEKDKKIRGDEVHLVIVQRPGKPEIIPVPLGEVEEWLKEGL